MLSTELKPNMTIEELYTHIANKSKQGNSDKPYYDVWLDCLVSLLTSETDWKASISTLGNIGLVFANAERYARKAQSRSTELDDTIEVVDDNRESFTYSLFVNVEGIPTKVNEYSFPLDCPSDKDSLTMFLDTLCDTYRTTLLTAMEYARPITRKDTLKLLQYKVQSYPSLV